MATTPEPYNHLREYIRDVALGFLVVIGGFVLAEAVAEPFRHLTRLAYPAALCLGLAPFWWFTRRCRLHDFDFLDYAVMSLFLMLFAALRLWAGVEQHWIATIPFACFCGGWFRLRHKLRGSRNGIHRE